MNYDSIIVGAGISGLYTAYKLSKMGQKVLIVDKNNYIGGRIYTFKKKINGKKIQYEAGAGRFANIHKLLMKLIKEFGYENDLIQIPNRRVPIVRGLTYENRKQLRKVYKALPHEKLDIQWLIEYIIKKSYGFSEQFLRTISFLNLANHVLSSPAAQFLFDAFGYDAELDEQNGFDGIRMFKQDFSFKNKYYILKCGLSTICDELRDRIVSNNGKIMLEKELLNWTYKHGIFTCEIEGVIETFKFTCKNLVLAIPKTALMKISKLYSIRKDLNSVIGHDLNRVYAIYPKSSDGKMWFKDLPKITTDNPIQYIIPINHKQGLIMITYSDAKWANFWRQTIQKGTLECNLEKNLKRLFPNRDIPEPTYLRCHFWKDGAHFWRPGYKSYEISKKLIKPFDSNLFIVGECYSMRQAWIEGALETAEIALKKILDQSGGNLLKTRLNELKKQNNGKLSTYSITEIKKHNKIDDAWMVVDNFVLDITNWISMHPGGNIIMKGVGKDATKLWNSIPSHNIGIKKSIFPKFLIGVLK